MLLAKLNALKSLNKMCFKQNAQRLLVLLSLLSASNSALAEETVEVGKHVTTPTDSLSMLLSLMFVLAVILMAAWVLKRFNIVQHGATQGIRVISSVNLGTKEKLVIVEVGNEQIMLGVTSQQVNLIKVLDEKLPTSQPDSSSLEQPFAKSLQKYFRQKS